MPRIEGLKDIQTGPAKPTAPSFELSPQQEAAIEFVREGKGNAILNAVAGAGKTSTLIEMCKHLSGTAAYAAFNKKIADEIGRKLLEAGVDKRTVKAATFHSFGFAAWRKAAPGVSVDADKTDMICDEMSVPSHFRGFARKAVSLCKQSCAEILWDVYSDSVWQQLVDHFDLADMLSDEDFFSFKDADEVLSDAIRWSIQVFKAGLEADREIIDFDDMLFAPLYHGASFQQTDWVMIDEAQDTNPARRLIAEKMLKPGGRLIAVGDPHQAIYGFTGADADAMDLIAETFDCIELPLTVSFRCAKKVVAHAQKWVPHIEAAPWAPEGEVRWMEIEEFKQLVPGKDDAILCRLNRPLMEIALGYIRRKIPCHIEGRDIGKNLLQLVKKWRTIRTVEELSIKLEDYRARELEKIQGKLAKQAALNDKIDTVQLILDTFPRDSSLREVERLIWDLFRDTEGQPIDSVTLSTIHKAKGREWPTVYLYGRDKWMPGPWATQLWEIEQENNLIYVGVTRAKQTLIEVKVPE